MKYFKSDLWLEIQDTIKGDDAEKQWRKNSELYNKYFNTIRHKLPKKFMKVYEGEKGFHDFVIEEISIKPSPKKSCGIINTLNIKLKKESRLYSLEFNKVEKTKMDFSDNSYCICGKISWGYSELELLENGNIKLSVLCDIVNEIEMVFKSVTIKNISK